MTCNHRSTIVLREFFYGNRYFTLERCESGCDELLICEKHENNITKTMIFIDVIDKLKKLEHDNIALRGALGEAIPNWHDGKLWDGSVPKNIIVNLVKVCEEEDCNELAVVRYCEYHAPQKSSPVGCCKHGFDIYCTECAGDKQ